MTNMRIILAVLSLFTLGLASSPVCDTLTAGTRQTEDGDALSITLVTSGPTIGDADHGDDPIEFSHCSYIALRFTPQGVHDLLYPLTWTCNIGLIYSSGNGELARWYWWDAPQHGQFGLVVTVTDSRGHSESRHIQVKPTNSGPVIESSMSRPVTVSIGTTKSQTIAAIDDCDYLRWSIVDRDGAIGQITLYEDYGDYSDGYGLATITYTPDPADIGLRTFVLAVSDGDPALEPVTCTMTWNVTDSASYRVDIEKVNIAIQGAFCDVAINLTRADTSASYGLGGFDILVGYDNSVLAFQIAGEGDIYDQCTWEYFTYRFSYDGDCDSCPSGLTRVIGIAETSNGPHHPTCDVDTLPVKLAYLRFLVTNDRQYECQFVPVRFFWTYCRDNILWDNSSDKQFISTDVFDLDTAFNPISIADGASGFPTYLGAQNECLVQAVPGHPLPTRQVDFYNGGVHLACGEEIEIDVTGDINLNGNAWEIADGRMFTNYFIAGLRAFGTHVAASTAASDCNRDGVALTVSDLVYFIRVIVGDAIPYPLFEPVTTTFDFDSDTLFVADPMGAAHLVFADSVTPTLLATNMSMECGRFDGNTHVLIYGTSANRTFSGDFLHVEGRLVSFEFATYDGRPVVAKNVELPESFLLHQNYPNPFNPKTTIDFELPQAADVTLDVFNTSGQHVATLVSKHLEAGEHTAEWDATGFASGIYMYRLQAGAYSGTLKMVLLK